MLTAHYYISQFEKNGFITDFEMKNKFPKEKLEKEDITENSDSNFDNIGT